MKVSGFFVGMLMSSAMFLCSQSWAEWSQFAAVTADNWNDFEPPLRFAKPEYDSERQVVEFTYRVGSHYSLWLVVSPRSLSSSEQNQRGRAWCGASNIDLERGEFTACLDSEGLPEGAKFIPLNVVEMRSPWSFVLPNIDVDQTYSIPLGENDYRYLYIDYEAITYDGGYHLSIDLNSFEFEQNSTVREE